MKALMNMRRQQGMALVTVLLIVAMAVTIAGFIVEQQAFWQRGMEQGNDRAQARYIAEAGVDWARAVLADDAATSTYDDAKEIWASQLPPVQLDNGEVRGVIHDQQGLFNLNSLTQQGVVNPTALARYQRLLDTLGLPLQLADTLADWIDSNSEARSSGAEDDYYLALTPPAHEPYRTANRLLTDMGELAFVRGYDADAIRRLAPFVTVLPEENTSVNVNFAPPEVLMAMLPKLDLQTARQLALKAADAGYKTIDEFYAQLPPAVAHNGNMNLDVKSNYFLVDGYATQGGGRASVQVLLNRASNWATVVRRNLQ
jgi:general secretion pathway protein K